MDVLHLLRRKPRVLKFGNDVLEILVVSEATRGSRLARGARHDARHAVHRLIDRLRSGRFPGSAESRSKVVGHQVVHLAGTSAAGPLSGLHHHADPDELAEVRVERVRRSVERLRDLTDRTWSKSAHRLDDLEAHWGHHDGPVVGAGDDVDRKAGHCWQHTHFVI